MVMLAELKLHLHDEYKQNDEVKQCLKHHIAGPPHHLQPRAESTSTTPASSILTAPLVSTLQQPGSEGMEADDDKITSSAGPADGSLNDIMQNLLNLINADSKPEQNHTQSSILLSLKDLLTLKLNTGRIHQTQQVLVVC